MAGLPRAPNISNTMTTRSNKTLTRRRVLQAMTLVPPTLTLAACSNQTAPIPTVPPPAPTETATVEVVIATQPADAAVATNTPVVAKTLPPTPACDDGDEPTPPQTEGPYFTPKSPERNSFIEAGMSGTRMTVSGFVLATNCQPVARALLDVWHCDDQGRYDNSGYWLRGHFFTDEAGRYSLETIMPGIYVGRTRHYHVKVQAPNQTVLTTQLYFPDEPANARDGIYRKECEMSVQDNADGSKAGSFNFVLNLV